ncbi:Aste57867_25551 [Aphanomyces stellatus]|uniref:Aste57867_25551 protein n=1 Tax=Aphanomyces stellatus TaxID=120398 RepID=A0A485LTI1_9STRA|nr:hypothetical protein As57867_025472 [Aphanomyces stellatus]VFU02174.1 Aste57867_25551 [Aphanomyces stellatus]
MLSASSSTPAHGLAMHVTAHMVVPPTDDDDPTAVFVQILWSYRSVGATQGHPCTAATAPCLLPFNVTTTTTEEDHVTTSVHVDGAYVASTPNLQSTNVTVGPFHRGATLAFAVTLLRDPTQARQGQCPMLATCYPVESSTSTDVVVVVPTTAPPPPVTTTTPTATALAIASVVAPPRDDHFVWTLAMAAVVVCAVAMLWAVRTWTRASDVLDKADGDDDDRCPKTLPLSPRRDACLSDVASVLHDVLGAVEMQAHDADAVVVAVVTDDVAPPPIRKPAIKKTPLTSQMSKRISKKNLVPQNAVQALQAKIADGAISDDSMKAMEVLLVVERQRLLRSKSERRQGHADADTSVHALDEDDKAKHFRMVLTRDLADGLSLRLLQLTKRSEATATFTIDRALTTISWQFTSLAAKFAKGSHWFELASIQDVHALTNDLPGGGYREAFPRLVPTQSDVTTPSDSLYLVHVIYLHATQPKDILIRCKSAAQQEQLAQGFRALQHKSTAASSAEPST